MRIIAEKKPRQDRSADRGPIQTAKGTSRFLFRGLLLPSHGTETPQCRGAMSRRRPRGRTGVSASPVAAPPIPALPSFSARTSSTPSSRKRLCIEQNLGPHMEQNSALLKHSEGSVSSCMERAVSGSSERANCLSQSKANRAREISSSRSRAPGPSPRDVGGVGRDLVGDDPLPDVVIVGQPEVLLGRDVAEEGGPRLPGQGRPDRGRDVVVAGSDVGHQRPQHVEGGLMADPLLHLHVHGDLVHGDVAGPLDHDLHVLLPGPQGQLPEGLQLGELGLVGGVGQAPRPEAVAGADGDVVAAADLQDLVPVDVERVLGAVRHHPVGHERPAPADDARDAVAGQRQVLQEDTGVERHVVHPLLRLVLHHVDEIVVLHLLDGFQPGHDLIDGDRADGDRCCDAGWPPGWRRCRRRC